MHTNAWSTLSSFVWTGALRVLFCIVLCFFPHHFLAFCFSLLHLYKGQTLLDSLDHILIQWFTEDVFHEILEDGFWDFTRSLIIICTPASQIQINVPASLLIIMFSESATLFVSDPKSHSLSELTNYPSKSEGHKHLNHILTIYCVQMHRKYIQYIQQLCSLDRCSSNLHTKIASLTKM